MISSFTSLSNKYNNLLNNYKQTYQNYVNSISDSSNNPLIIVPNYLFLGESIINTSTTLLVEDCLDSCLSIEKCTGANYLSDSKNCILSQGKGSLIPSSFTNKKESAIVYTSLKLSYDLKYINQQLLELNKNITELLENSSNDESKNANKDAGEFIKKDYSVLMKERTKINRIILEEELLNSQNNNSQLVVTQNYYNYIVYLFIVLFLIFLFIKFFFSSPNQRGGKKFLSL